MHVLFAERDRDVEVAPVSRHGGDVGACLHQLLGRLPRAVGTEVEEDRAVARRVEPWTVRDDDGLDELIRDPSLVTTPNRLDRIRGLVAGALDDGVEGARDPLP